MKKYCMICGRQTLAPVADFVGHFRPYASGNWGYVVGNCKTFGFWSGMRSNVTLLFPFLNTIIHWKYRKMSLEIPGLDEESLVPLDQPKEKI